MSTTFCTVSKPCSSYTQTFSSINILRTYSDYLQLLQFSTARTEYTECYGEKLVGLIFQQVVLRRKNMENMQNKLIFILKLFP